jgi:hypothetical protein
MSDEYFASRLQSGQVFLEKKEVPTLTPLTCRHDVCHTSGKLLQAQGNPIPKNSLKRILEEG